MIFKKEYPDLHKNARVSHEKFGTGTVVVRFRDWTYYEVLVQYDNGKRIWTNPARLSTKEN